MANFEVVKVCLPEYGGGNEEVAGTLVCELHFEQTNRQCCKCGQRSKTQSHKMEEIPDEPRAKWRAFNEKGVQVSLFSIDMRTKKKRKKFARRAEMYCVATVSRRLLDLEKESNSQPVTPQRTLSANSRGEGLLKVFKAYGDIGIAMTAKGGVSRLVGNEDSHVVELQFRAPQPHPFQIDRCKPRYRSHMILECWAQHRKAKLLDNHKRTEGTYFSKGLSSIGFKPLLSRTDTNKSSIGSFASIFGLSHVFSTHTQDLDADRHKEKPWRIEPEVNDWRPRGVHGWKRLWESGEELVYGDRMRRGVAVTDVMEVHFRKDAVLLFNTLFPKVSLLKLFSMIAACAPNLFNENDPVAEHSKAQLKMMGKTGRVSHPKLKACSTFLETYKPRHKSSKTLNFAAASSFRDRIASTSSMSFRTDATKSGATSRITSKNAIEGYAVTVLFMKRLLICLALCGVHFTEEDNLPALGQVWPFPLASLFGHGNRVIMRLEEIDVYDFLNVLLGGDPQVNDMRKRGIPWPFQKRIAATHNIEVADGHVAERSLKATSAADVASTVADGLAGKHLGLDLPLGGLGNVSPMWKTGMKKPACVGFRGEAVLEDSHRVQPGIQGGHLYVRIDEMGQQMHGAAWFTHRNLDDINAKFDLYATLPSKIPHDTKAAASNTQEVRSCSKRISSCPPRMRFGHNLKESVLPCISTVSPTRTPRKETNSAELLRPWFWKSLENFGLLDEPPNVSAMQALLKACNGPELAESEQQALLEELQGKQCALEVQPGYRVVRVMRKVVLNFDYMESSLVMVAMQVDDEAVCHFQPRFLSTSLLLPTETECQAALRALEHSLLDLFEELPMDYVCGAFRNSKKYRDELDDRESTAYPGLCSHRWTRTYRIDGEVDSWLARALQRAGFLDEDGEPHDAVVKVQRQSANEHRIVQHWKWFSVDRLCILGLRHNTDAGRTEYVYQSEDCIQVARTSSDMPSEQKLSSRSRQVVMNTDIDYHHVSTLMIGLESTAPFKRSPLGQKHDSSGVSNTFSAMNNWKWRFYRKYNALQIPADLGALRVSVTKHRLSFLKEILDSLSLSNPADEWSDPDSFSIWMESRNLHSVWSRRDILNRRKVEEALFQNILSKSPAEARDALIAHAEDNSLRGVKRWTVDRFGLHIASKEIRDRLGYHKHWHGNGMDEFGLPLGTFRLRGSAAAFADEETLAVCHTYSTMVDEEALMARLMKRRTLIEAGALGVFWCRRNEEGEETKSYGRTATDEHLLGHTNKAKKVKGLGPSPGYLQRFENIDNSMTLDAEIFSVGSPCSSPKSSEMEPCGSIQYQLENQPDGVATVDATDADDSGLEDEVELKLTISKRSFDKVIQKKEAPIASDALVASMTLTYENTEDLPPDTTDPLPEFETGENFGWRAGLSCFRCQSPRGASVPATAEAPASCCVCNIYMPGGSQLRHRHAPFLPPNG